MILAIDTSTDQASVALTDGAIPVAEWSWLAKGNHSHHLTQIIRQLLDVAGAPVTSVTAVVVATGPGSFNSIRVGMSEAKGVALALAVPLVGISTLDVIAHQASAISPDVWAIVPAGRGQVSLAHYTGGLPEWRRVSDYRTVTIEDAAWMVEGAGLLAGCGADEVGRMVQERGQPVWLEPAGWRMRRAVFLAELGRRYLEAGGGDQLDSLAPLYLRRSSAEEKRIARAQE